MGEYDTRVTDGVDAVVTVVDVCDVCGCMVDDIDCECAGDVIAGVLNGDIDNCVYDVTGVVCSCLDVGVCDIGIGVCSGYADVGVADVIGGVTGVANGVCVDVGIRVTPATPSTALPSSKITT